MSGEQHTGMTNQEISLGEATVAYRTEEAQGAYQLRTPEDRGWEEFREQCRRQMQRPIENRIKYGFARKAKQHPREDTSRVFNAMEDYRKWCEENLPDYLGYRRARNEVMEPKL